MHDTQVLVALQVALQAADGAPMNKYTDTNTDTDTDTDNSYIYIYIYIYTHTHTHTHIYIYIYNVISVHAYTLCTRIACRTRKT